MQMRANLRNGLARKAVRRTAIFLAGVLLSLTLLELGARVLSNVLGMSPYMTYDAQLGWIAKLNSIKEHRDRNKQFDVTYEINESGFRGPKYPLARDDNLYRIVVLGDSTGFGWGVDLANTFATILDRELDDTEVINLSLSGYGIDQSYLRFVREGIGYKPDLVILQVSHNDFEEIMHPFFNQKPKPHFLKSAAGAPTLTNVPAKPLGKRAEYFYDNSLPVPFKEWLGWHSYTFNLMNEIYYGLRHRSSTNATSLDSIYSTASIDLFNSIVGLLQARLDEIGAKGLLVFSTKEISENGYIVQDHLKVLDLYPAFLDAGIGDPSKYYFSDGYHWNIAGHHLVAEELKRAIGTLRSN